jgi:hypothetical protein
VRWAVGRTEGAGHRRLGWKSRVGGGRVGEESVAVVGGRCRDDDVRKKGEGHAFSLSCDRSCDRCVQSETSLRSCLCFIQMLINNIFLLDIEILLFCKDIELSLSVHHC